MMSYLFEMISYFTEQNILYYIAGISSWQARVLLFCTRTTSLFCAQKTYERFHLYHYSVYWFTLTKIHWDILNDYIANVFIILVFAKNSLNNRHQYWRVYIIFFIQNSCQPIFEFSPIDIVLFHVEIKYNSRNANFASAPNLVFWVTVHTK